MPPAIVYLLGTSYCGSSLLNLLLDAQPGIRGLGEAVHLRGGPTIATCALCEAPVAACPVYARIDHAAFYESLLEIYGDSRILVDASKSLELSALAGPRPPRVPERAIVLSKSPHEFAHSYCGHHPEADVESALAVYAEFYARQLKLVERQPWSDGACLQVTYRELTTDPHQTLSRVLDFLGCDSPLHDCLWQTDTHIVGGNWMIYSQLQERRERFAAAASYLNGKYAGRYRQTFYDDHWRRDAVLVARCLDLYRAEEHIWNPLLASLGQPAVSRQLELLA